MLREELSVDGRFNLQPAGLARKEDLLRVHSVDYVNAFLAGELDSSLMRRIGFPWSQELVLRTLGSVGGTMLAMQAALAGGFGGTLAGGTHHAFRSEGAGFCVFNDIAIAIELLRETSRLTRIAVIDLDVHQGDGTAAIFAGDQNVFTLSVHGERNFPLRKQTSTLDIPLPDDTRDREYLAALEPALQSVWAFAPEFVFFQAGVDGLATDSLGRLSLTHEGLKARDALVIQGAWRLQSPLVITLGGGYSDPIGPTVQAHAQTFRVAAEHYLSGRS